MSIRCGACLQARFHGYAVAGDPSVPTHGDFYAGKGIGHAVLQTSAGLLSIFNTHTCANYSHQYKEPVKGLKCRIPADTDAAIRISQVLQLASLVQVAQQQGYMGTVIAGDLNCPPDSLEMHIFKALLPDLHDCWLEQHPDQPGYTSNAADNTFTKPGGDPPSRIDYVWVSGKPVGARVTMQRAHKSCSYSDHLGVEAVCKFEEACPGRHMTATAREIIGKNPQLFEAAQGIMQQCADRFQNSRKRWVLLAIWCAFAAVMLFAVAVAFPWWHYQRAALPVVLCIFAVSCAASPVSFILGFAGFGSIAAAMKEAVQHLQLCLSPCIL
ncbi:TPA: hypothetical protein ACH3X1_001912 [Trebouxia sp. C0004]